MHFEGQLRVWLTWLARLGSATKGLVYLLAGALALLAATSATRTVGERVLGKALLALTAAALLGFSSYRIVEALVDPEGKGEGADGIAKRIGYGLSAGVHAALAALALEMMAGGRGAEGTKSWLGALLVDTSGRVMVALVGLAIIAVGAVQLYGAKTKRLGDELDLAGLSGGARALAIACGRVGRAARGVVFPIIGFYLAKSAIADDPSEARELGGALAELASRPSGTAVLAIVAAGLFAYGFFMLALARYRRIVVP
jgi:hypothetical protein